jgi:hypothetical protein
LLRLYFALLDTAQLEPDADLQSLEQALQEVQTLYDKIIRDEDQRLKQNAKKRRQRAAKQLGTAKSIEEAADILVQKLKLARDDLLQQGII